MAHPIVMPSFGMYTSEGKLVNWLCASGSTVAAGQTIAEIETEKAVQELPCPADGVLHHVAAIGAVLKEEHLIGYVLAPGETPPSASTAGASSSAHGPGSASGSEPPATTPGPAPDRGYIKASPIAKRLAAEHGLDLAAITGSGPGGRIVEADVRAAAQKSAPPAAAEQPAASTPTVRARLPLTPMRRAISQRLRHGLETAVALTLTRGVEADVLVAARHSANAGRDASIPFDAWFVKLLAAALQDHPDLNSTIEGDTLVQWADINIGVAVSLPAGLVVPVIHRADALPLLEVASRIRALAARAREGSLPASDLAGGTCTITNLGAAGIDGFTPVLNPPQSCILGIGRIRPRPVVRDGALVVAHTCVLSLTFDHRVTDGAPAAALLDAIARRMNDTAWLAGLLEKHR